MQLIDAILWVEFSDFIAAGFKEDTIKKANLRNGPYWIMTRNPRDARRPMVQYDTLRQEHKDKLTAHYGDVYQYMAQQPIMAMLQPADKARAWFAAYTYAGPDGPSTHLKAEHVDMCTRRAQWMDMFSTIKVKEVRELTGLTKMSDFYTHCVQLANKQGAKLPTAYNTIMILIRDYVGQGYKALLPPRLGNKNGLKVADATAQALLVQLLADPRQHDDVFIARAYNAWAKQNGYEAITESAVGVWRRKHAHEITMHRNGNKEWRNKYGMVIKGQRPSAPLLMWEHDDNHIDLFFQAEGSAYQRVKGIFIIDSHCDYVLGYYITPGELKAEHVRLAYLNAMHHVHELTGEWLLPYEVKSDRWNSKQLLPFYESIGYYQQSTVGGSRGRGYLEQFFGTSDWQNCLKAGSNNYNGQNITASQRGVNVEWLAGNKKEWPALADAPNQVAQFVERLRLLPAKGGKSRQQLWCEAFSSMPEDRKRPVSRDQFLSIFGLRHEPQGRPVSITNKGVEVQINGHRLLYSIPPAFLLANIGKKVTVQYDPADLSRVLLTDDERLRLVATYNPGIAKAMADYTPGHREQLNALLQQQVDDVQRVVDAAEQRQQVLQQAGIDPEALLKANVLVKEQRQLAEQAYYVPQLADGADFDPLATM